MSEVNRCGECLRAEASRQRSHKWGALTSSELLFQSLINQGGEGRGAEEEGAVDRSMAVGGLLRCLVSPAGGVAAWLPCHELLASPSSAWQHWLSSLALPRLRPPCADGFKLLLVLLLVSAAIAEVRFIASSSMAPTLRPGDRAVAEKVTLFQVTYLFRRPSIGDIVFFKVPTALQVCLVSLVPCQFFILEMTMCSFQLQNYGLNKDVVFIKRVLATPGDFIEVRQGQLIINGVAQIEHYTSTHVAYTMEAMVCAYLILCEHCLLEQH
ncbi:hypothetical protein EJB05_40322, partial [Eragrostis curvula]